MSTIIRPLSIAIALSLGLIGANAGMGCRVINEDHCANKEIPGNAWCKRLSSSTAFCSPCIAAFHGCIATEPFSCEGYDPQIFDGGDEPEDEDGSSDGATMGAPTGGSGGMNTGG